ncbi:MAG TPA: DinB family protein [Bryobacteraceae bacterium]|jgi:hypothetical protein|nr:DinB family protein [Bryobacteraceae bacterium]
MDHIQSLRNELDRLLGGKGAHTTFDEGVAGFPANLRGVRPEGSPHSAWEVLEHLRIAQWDMLEFSRDTKHKSPAWPEGYWPKNPEPLSAAAWDESIQHFHRDLAAMRSLVANPESDLFTPFAHGDGQTLLREALQLADHNAYHTGELIFLRRQLGAAT